MTAQRRRGVVIAAVLALVLALAIAGATALADGDRATATDDRNPSPAKVASNTAVSQAKKALKKAKKAKRAAKKALQRAKRNTRKVNTNEAAIAANAAAIDELRPGSPIPSGATVTGAWALHQGQSGLNQSIREIYSFPGPAPQAVMPDDVNFEADVGALDGDAACEGTLAHPTAPPGKVCIYLDTSFVTVLINLQGVSPLADGSTHGFMITSNSSQAGSDAFATGSWAYTAP